MPERTGPSVQQPPRRCAWATGNATGEMVAYHDTEWGVPLHDDRALFEFLILEGAQAGLSWSTILRKRAAYRAAFADFDPARVAAFDEAKIAALLADPGIVRNGAKIRAAIQNARGVLAIQREHGSLDAYLWRFVDGALLQHAWPSPREVPAATPQSEAMSRALRARGFAFVGPTICYAFMQAVGIANETQWLRVLSAERGRLLTA